MWRNITTCDTIKILISLQSSEIFQLLFIKVFKLTLVSEYILIFWVNWPFKVQLRPLSSAFLRHITCFCFIKSTITPIDVRAGFSLNCGRLDSSSCLTLCWLTRWFVALWRCSDIQLQFSEHQLGHTESQVYLLVSRLRALMHDEVRGHYSSDVSSHHLINT